MKEILVIAGGLFGAFLLFGIIAEAVRDLRNDCDGRRHEKIPE